VAIAAAAVILEEIYAGGAGEATAATATAATCYNIREIKSLQYQQMGMQ
jgi:hypothetical protein